MSAKERAAKTAMSCSAPSCSKNCASTGIGCGEKPATGSFPATVGILRITRSTQKCYTTPAKEPRSARVSTGPSIPTPCAIASPLICSRPALICAPSTNASRKLSSPRLAAVTWTCSRVIGKVKFHLDGNRVISNDAGLLQELFEQTGTAA